MSALKPVHGHFLEIFALVLSLTLCSTSVLSQINTAQMIIGGQGDDLVGHIAQSSNGYVFAGNTTSYGAGGQDILVFEADTAGNMSWSLAFGGSSDDMATGVLTLADGSFILTGRTRSFGKGDIDLFFSRISPQGEVTSFKTYGGLVEDRIMGITPTLDGQFLIYGSTRSGSKGLLDIIVLKVTKYGDVIWSRVLGGPVTDVTYSIKETPGGDYIVFAYTNSWEDLYGATDGYLIKLNVNGDILWNKSFGGSDYELLTNSDAALITESGEIFMTGATHSMGAGDYDEFLIKFDAMGELDWAKTIGGTGYDFGRAITRTIDNGILVYGLITDPESGDRGSLLTKFSQGGELLWSQAYGGTQTNDIYTLHENEDGSLFATGKIEGHGESGADIWVINIDPSGMSDCYMSDFVPEIAPAEFESRFCDVYRGTISMEISEIDLAELSIEQDLPMDVYSACELVGTDGNTHSFPKNFHVAPNMPNPFNPATQIKFDVPENTRVSLAIYNVKGQKIIELLNKDFQPGSYRQDWDGRDKDGKVMPSGVYICRMVAGKISSEQEILLLK